MKPMHKMIRATIMIVGIMVAVVSCNSCRPIKNFTDTNLPKEQDFYKSPFDFSKEYKTVVILADVEGTEIFDLLAPYSILNYLDSLNVLILSQVNSSIPLWKGLTVYPHYSLEEFNQLDIKPDLMVVPNLFNPNDEKVLNWINEISPETTVLSVCEGSRVIAETGRFSGHSIATHHSSFKQQKKQYPEMNWTKGFRYLENNNLISTSGVAAAVEGALVAAQKLDPVKGAQITKIINYPHDSIQRVMEPRGMGLNDVVKILAKTSFKGNKHLAIFVPEGFDEYRIGAILDTYNRTFPMSLNTVSQSTGLVSSRNQLLAKTTGNIDSLQNLDEIIVPLGSAELSPETRLWLQQKAAYFESELIFYDHQTYLFHQLFDRIAEQYGNGYATTVFRLLDYDLTADFKN